MNAEQLRQYKSGLYDTPSSVEEALERATNAPEVILMMMAVNATIETIARLLEEEEDNIPEWPYKPKEAS